jgi:hypothetical protein
MQTKAVLRSLESVDLRDVPFHEIDHDNYQLDLASVLKSNPGEETHLHGKNLKALDGKLCVIRVHTVLSE